MGQKVNPIGLRIGVNRTWDSRWYAEGDQYVKILHEEIGFPVFKRRFRGPLYFLADAGIGFLEVNFFLWLIDLRQPGLRALRFERANLLPWFQLGRV